MELQMTPTFIGWKYPNGSIRITVETAGEHEGDNTILTYSPLAGVEVGATKVLALDERPEIIVFSGPYEDQRKCFAAWVRLANENERPAIFCNEGLAAPAKLDPAPMPSLPKIDEDPTELANDVLGVSRELMEEASEVKALTLEDCRVIVATVAEAATPDMGVDLV
jgi:hypothetical protein